MVRENLKEVGISLEDRYIHHDKDSVYTGYRWLQVVLIREKARIFFSENGAKGNTFMESFNGHFKGENGSLFFDAANIWELARAISVQVDYHNARRRHSACLRAPACRIRDADRNTHRQALGYLAPLTCINQEVSLPEPILDLALLST